VRLEGATAFEEDVRFGLPKELEEIARHAGKTLPARRSAGVDEE
jgi:hypothetical protein